MCGMGCSSWGLLAAYSYLRFSVANVARPTKDLLFCIVIRIGWNWTAAAAYAGAKRQRLVVIIIQAN